MYMAHASPRKRCPGRKAGHPRSTTPTANKGAAEPQRAVPHSMHAHVLCADADTECAAARGRTHFARMRMRSPRWMLILCEGNNLITLMMS